MPCPRRRHRSSVAGPVWPAVISWAQKFPGRSAGGSAFLSHKNTACHAGSATSHRRLHPRRLYPGRAGGPAVGSAAASATAGVCRPGREEARRCWMKGAAPPVVGRAKAVGRREAPTPGARAAARHRRRRDERGAPAPRARALARALAVGTSSMREPICKPLSVNRKASHVTDSLAAGGPDV
jgi:hypothetical protein